jgi:hypothetical protein
MKTKIFFSLILLFKFVESSGQCGSWNWAVQSKGNNDSGGIVITDSSGNSFICGQYFTNFAMGSYTFGNVGSGDVYIVKLDPQGNILWARGFGGSGDEAASIAVDKSGNLYAAGYFQSSTFYIDTFALHNASSNGKLDIFIVKFDPFGNILFVKTFGGTDGDQLGGLTVDSNSNLFITGSYVSNPAVLGGVSLKAPGMFVAKLDSAANVVWVNGPENAVFGGFGDITCDEKGNVYLVGDVYAWPLYIGDDTLISTNGGNANMFLIELDSLGNIRWTKQFGGIGPDIAGDLHYDRHGGLYLTGFFQSPSFIFGGNTINNHSSAGNSDDAFLLKFDTLANELWGKSIGGAATWERGKSVTTDLSGNVYVTGGFWSNSITIGSITLTNSGVNTPEIFLVEYDLAGSPIWADSYGDISGDDGTCVTVDNDGNLYLTGSFYRHLSFGGTNLVAPVSNVPSVYLAKMGCSTLNLTKISSSNALKLFPNPASEYFEVEYPETNALLDIEIFDLDGSRILMKKNVHNTQKINLSEIGSGLFYVKIVSGCNVYFQKISIEH